ncbi:hypothetical protein DES51_1398 [Dielma fastidiosa]|uniref:Uncharacterized protein n=2 Tax=Dielma fastidiosa TaxID=1034346 RepID=A0A318KDB8_9FIRM|nr:hypothetical protein [Dielma fastidiosa]PXX73405.1 hypothetical protein DES51_1398 [Dielma fastidiosa]
MRKENYACIITKHFGSNSDEIVTERYDKSTGATTEVVEPLSKYATHPTGYRHQLELLGYVRIKETGGAFNGIYGSTE